MTQQDLLDTLHSNIEASRKINAELHAAASHLRGEGKENHEIHLTGDQKVDKILSILESK